MLSRRQALDWSNVGSLSIGPPRNTILYIFKSASNIIGRWITIWKFCLQNGGYFVWSQCDVLGVVVWDVNYLCLASFRCFQILWIYVTSQTSVARNECFIVHASKRSTNKRLQMPNVLLIEAKLNHGKNSFTRTPHCSVCMMTSSIGNIFCVIGL